MTTDIAIVGAGAAGLAAAIAAAESGAESVLLLDGAQRLGAKILISGGGRCNVTHERITPEDFSGGPRTMIRSVLKAFDQRRTVAWMESLGVELKIEETGKLFPVTDKAQSVLDALLNRVKELGIQLRTNTQVESITPEDGGFMLITAEGPMRVKRVVLATGGKSVPKTGSTGFGFEAMERLGHTIIPTTPALVPLLLEKGEGIGGRFADFSGMTLDARLQLETEHGEKLAECTGSFLFTHQGCSGPVVLDISRHLLRARMEQPGAKFKLCFGHPKFKTREQADEWLLQQLKLNPRGSVAQGLRARWPARLAEAFAEGMTTFDQMKREQRRAIAEGMAAMPLPVVGDRGFQVAEVTAGGVDLREVDVRTMESRIVPGLHLCGEVLDVDGRIGGFNFQWAWSSGQVAGRGAARTG